MRPPERCPTIQPLRWTNAGPCGEQQASFTRTKFPLLPEGRVQVPGHWSYLAGQYVEQNNTASLPGLNFLIWKVSTLTPQQTTTRKQLWCQTVADTLAITHQEKLKQSRARVTWGQPGKHTPVLTTPVRTTNALIILCHLRFYKESGVHQLRRKTELISALP